MTKKHFTWAAEYIRAMILQEAEDVEAVRQFALDMFAHFGENFDRDRFLFACKPLAPKKNQG